MRGLLLIGTDTGVGKTTLAEGLLRLSYRCGTNVVPFKPVETGCTALASDAARLSAAAVRPELQATDICPFSFTPPTAPSVAAQLEKRTISIDRLVESARALASRGDWVLIESAGGLLTPYTDGITSLSLAELFDVSVMLVAANRLGTINHTSLALNEIRRRELRFAGLVLVNVDSMQAPDRAFNASEIQRITGIRPVGTLRFCPNPTADGLADAVAADLDLTTIFDGALVPSDTRMR